jgi:hypothetical protein
MEAILRMPRDLFNREIEYLPISAIAVGIWSCDEYMGRLSARLIAAADERMPAMQRRLGYTPGGQTRQPAVWLQVGSERQL